MHYFLSARYFDSIELECTMALWHVMGTNRSIFEELGSRILNQMPSSEIRQRFTSLRFETCWWRPEPSDSRQANKYWADSEVSCTFHVSPKFFSHNFARVLNYRRVQFIASTCVLVYLIVSSLQSKLLDLGKRSHGGASPFQVSLSMPVCTFNILSLGKRPWRRAPFPGMFP